MGEKFFSKSGNILGRLNERKIFGILSMSSGKGRKLLWMWYALAGDIKFLNYYRDRRRAQKPTVINLFKIVN